MATKPIFQLRKNPSDKNMVLMIFNYKGRRVNLSTGLSIPEKYWNPQTKRVRENQAFPNYKSYNQRLNDFEAKTTALWAEYVAKGIIEEFKDELYKRVFDIKTEGPELLPFIKQVIEEREKLNVPKGSLQVYNNCLGHLVAFEQKRKKPLRFSKLNEAFLNDFTAYLFSLGFADSYIHKIISTLKMFVQLAKKQGVIDSSRLLDSKTPVKKREKDNIYLNEAEIQQLFEMKLEGKLAGVRDLFLIGCFTGLRFSDYSKIKRENIQPVEHNGKAVKCLVMTTQKTKQRVVLPLVNPMLLAILERHNWQAPKRISNQKLNDYLKELGKLAGFSQEVEVNRYVAGEHIKQTFQKWQLMTTHTARRSFATNAYKRGVPIPDIMKFTGHTTTQSFLKYIKVTSEESAVILSEHDFFTGKSPLKLVN